jgi:hypothetical protein
MLAVPYIAQLPSGNEFAKVPNPLLWEPVDTVKQRGYVVQSVTMGGPLLWATQVLKTIRTCTT